ncbi:hypothetical protein BH11MYX1_BH11MYX1_19030 [soil metagenome]
MLIFFARISVLVAAIAVPVSACSSSDTKVDADPFDTFQLCFTEHHATESFSIDKAIAICCLDHPIGTKAAGVVCGTTQASCETYVGSNLAGSDASGSDITASCADYITQRAQ